MQEWLICRGYTPVPRSSITIPGYEVPQTEVSAPQMDQLDYNIPYIIERCLGDTVNVRVMQTLNQEQIFVFVRNLTEAKFRKQDLFTLFDKFLSKAACVMISSPIPPLTSFGCFGLAAKLKQNLELLLLTDICYPKLRHKGVPQYMLLNKADVKALEQRLKRPRTSFPKMRLSSEATARYLGFKVGMVVYEPQNKIYRLIMA